VTDSTAADTPATDPTSGVDDLPGDLDVRLVTADMDGTLLDADSRVPESFWPVLDEMGRRGIAFAPASGRQYATLRRLFDRVADGMVFIAENGGMVVRDGERLSVTTMRRDGAHAIVRAARGARGYVRGGDGHGGTGGGVGTVLCGVESAYIERHDPRFVDECRTYYARLDLVDDLAAVDDEVVKIAVFDFDDASVVLPELREFTESHQVVVSGKHWVDIMPADVDKGVGLREAQRALGVTPAQTVAFGDYLNDSALLAGADWSFAMANAHPDLAAQARFRAPANTEAGVVTVLRRLLDPA